MKLCDLLSKDLIIEKNETFICKACGKTFSKLGICNHYFYCHEEDGKKKKEELRKIATENNNTIEMKKKISEGTIKAYEREEVRINHLNSVTSIEYKRTRSKQSKKNWDNENYRKKTIKSIKRSNRTKEFRDKMSVIITSIHNAPEATVKSSRFRNRMKQLVSKLWEDEKWRSNVVEGQKRSWDNDNRKKNQSKMASDLWKDPDHVEKVLDGKIRFLRKTGKQKSLGKVGITKGGNFYESLFEKKVFEYLEDKGIRFIPHILIPGTSKISDLVIDNIWIELDGLKRGIFKESSSYSWNGKIEIYEELKNQNIIENFLIFNSFNEFKKWAEVKLNVNQDY